MKQKISLYCFLSINFVFNLIILIILFICTKNIKILQGIQIFYFIVTILIWIFICIIYLGKLILLIINNKKKKISYFYNKKLKKYLISSWIITNGGAYLTMIIGFIYDIIVLIKGEKIGTVVYLIIYFSVFFVFVILSIIDFLYIDYIIILVLERPITQTRREENNTNTSLYDEEDKENKNIKGNKDNKAKNE